MGAPKPTVITPPPPTVYQSVQPLGSYQMTGDYLNRLQKQANTAQEQLYAQSGTPGELGARQAETRLKAAGTYLSSLPTGDKYTRANSGVSDQYAPAREASQTAFSQAQQDYATALSRSNQAAPPAYTAEDLQTPSWAKATIPEGMPGYKPPAPPANPPKNNYAAMFGSGLADFLNALSARRETQTKA